MVQNAGLDAVESLAVGATVAGPRCWHGGRGPRAWKNLPAGWEADFKGWTVGDSGSAEGGADPSLAKLGRAKS